jgi:gamma-glutamylcyclotransferase (GGCT)/AIG2-like uncharacterized protein YtfP
VIKHLFLYGTLLPELAPRELGHYVQRLRDRGQAFVPGRLYDVGPFPGAVVDPTANSQIQGRLFELPDDPAVLEALDYYEDDKLFTRTAADVTPVDEGSVAAWVYVYNQELDDATLIEHGDYLRWRREHSR